MLVSLVGFKGKPVEKGVWAAGLAPTPSRNGNTGSVKSPWASMVHCSSFGIPLLEGLSEGKNSPLTIGWGGWAGPLDDKRVYRLHCPAIA